MFPVLLVQPLGHLGRAARGRGGGREKSLRRTQDSKSFEYIVLIVLRAKRSCASLMSRATPARLTAVFDASRYMNDVIRHNITIGVKKLNRRLPDAFRSLNTKHENVSMGQRHLEALLLLPGPHCTVFLNTLNLQ